MKTMQKIIQHNEEEFVEMFQVEELEERLENKWSAEVGTSTNSQGTSVQGTVKYTF